MNPGNWPFSGRYVPRWKGLALDLAIAVAITIAITVALEWWRRKLWQYRLRSLFLFVLLLSAPMAWWRTMVMRSAREREMIAVLDQKGFAADLDCAAPVWLSRLVGTNQLPRFVARIRGPRRSNDLTSEAAQVTPGDELNAQDEVRAALAVAEGFANLHGLDLWEADDRTIPLVAGLAAELEQLGGAAQLRELDLSSTHVTDAGLEKLKGLSQLRNLDIRWTRVTDAGMKTLQQALPHCKIEWEPPTQDELQSPASPDQVP
jgi:hypothetical protein